MVIVPRTALTDLYAGWVSDIESSNLGQLLI